MLMLSYMLSSSSSNIKSMSATFVFARAYSNFRIERLTIYDDNIWWYICTNITPRTIIIVTLSNFHGLYTLWSKAIHTTNLNMKREMCWSEMCHNVTLQPYKGLTAKSCSRKGFNIIVNLHRVMKEYYKDARISLHPNTPQVWVTRLSICYNCCYINSCCYCCQFESHVSALMIHVDSAADVPMAIAMCWVQYHTCFVRNKAVHNIAPHRLLE